MKKIKLLTLSLLVLSGTANLLAQEYRPLMVAVVANATTLPTRSGEIFHNFHPGFVLGTSFRYNESPKNHFAQTLKIGYIYHQFVHHSVQLYSEFEYKRMLSSRLALSGAVGLGYIHLFMATQVFERNEQGHYDRMPNRGRPQIMGTTALGVGYLLNPGGEKPIELFTRYQFFVQGPFVRQYVPVLPNTALHLGVNYPLFKRN